MPCTGLGLDLGTDMGTYEVVARNFSEAHENKIHSDEIARKYGFKGAHWCLALRSGAI